jgi:hypothetical protein
VDTGQCNHSSEYDCQVVVNKYNSIFQGVIGTIVVNNEGVPIKSTLDNATTVQYSGLLNNLVDQVQYFYYFLSPIISYSVSFAEMLSLQF